MSLSSILGSDLVGSSASVNTSTTSTSGKPIVGSYTQTASGLTGVDAANYSFAGFTTTTPNYTISQRPLATWSGAGGNLLWSNPLNWDALPSLANVQAVAIPSNAGTVIYDSSAGNTTLSTASTLNALQLSGGTLTANGGLTANALTITGGQLGGSGSLLVNNAFSQSGGLITGFSSIDLRQNITTPLALTGGSIQSPGAFFSLANLGGPLSLQNVTLDASGATTGGRIDLNGTAISLLNSNLYTSGSSDGGSIQLGLGSPRLSGLSVSLPSSVSLSNSTLVADPPALGGLIAIDGRSITIASSLLNVFGTSGGSINLGSLNTNLLSLDPTSQLAMGSLASQNLLVGPGGTLSNNALIFINGTVYIPVTTTTQPIIQAIIASYIPTLTQTPINDQQTPSQSQTSTASFFSIPLTPASAPLPEPTVAISLAQSGFLFADTFELQTTVDPSPASKTATQGIQGPSSTQNQTNPSKTATLQITTDSSASPTTATQTKPAEQTSTSTEPESKKKPSQTTATSSATEPVGQALINSQQSPVTASQNQSQSAAAASTNATNNPSSTAGAGLDASGGINANVTSVPSAQASERFSQSESRAQGETAAKLGLNGKDAAPPTPAQIQGLLQRVMQSLRGRTSSSP